MLDIKLIRQNKKEVEARLRTKVPDTDLSPILALDEEIRKLKTHVETLKADRNNASKEIGDRKRKGEDAEEIIERVGQFSDEIHATDHKLQALETEFNDRMARLPNLPKEGVKIAAEPSENVVLKEWGKKREFNFTPKNHMELGESLKLFDFQRGAKVTGSGWPVYRGLGARLEWALINYMLSIHIKNGYEQWIVPLAVKRETIFGSGQLPKFEDQQFKITDKDFDFFLIPTSEVSLNGLHMDEILEEEQLPARYVSYTPCFRREAGAAGGKERGLIRVHQFNKVEMFVFSKPDESWNVFDSMCKSAEEILQGLGLHYRNMELVTGDMSYASAYTVDVEVWLPGQNRYYEVSSISNCTDFQARRSNIRFRKKGEKPEFVHTLNGSGLATSRLMVSLLECNQNADGSVTIPTVLRPYLGGLEVIAPE